VIAIQWHEEVRMDKIKKCLSKILLQNLNSVFISNLLVGQELSDENVPEPLVEMHGVGDGIVPLHGDHG